MIRINLLPAAKRKRSKAKAASSSTVTTGLIFGGMFAWVLLGGAGYYVLDVVEAETRAIRDDAEQNKKRTEEIRKLIDEEALEARRRKVADLKKAIETLEAQRRTPVFVMHELANVLSTGKVPDIDEEKQRKIEASDPQAKLNPNWDATSVWLSDLKEEGVGNLKITGSARDPADLDEFVKRLRSSVRFVSVSHAEFVAKASAGPSKRNEDAQQTRQYTFTISAAVSFWD